MSWHVSGASIAVSLSVRLYNNIKQLEKEPFLNLFTTEYYENISSQLTQHIERPLYRKTY